MYFSSIDTEKLVRLITGKDADMQARDSRGRTVLHHAVIQGQVQLAEIALKKGADVNAADNEDLTPLLAAACVREADKLLPLLIKHGADVSAKDWRGQNALHFLTRGPRMYTELVGLLIDKGVSLDDRESLSTYQPLHLAISFGRNKLVKKNFFSIYFHGIL